MADQLDRLNDTYGHSPTKNPPEASGTGATAIIKDETLVPPGPGQNALNLRSAPSSEEEHLVPPKPETTLDYGKEHSGEEEDLVPPKPDPNFTLFSDEEDDLDLPPVPAPPPSNNFYQIHF